MRKPQVALLAESPSTSVQTEPPRRRRGPSFEDRALAGESGLPPEGFESWTDYTKHALRVEDRFEEEGYQGMTPDISASLMDRRRSMGIDFGPQFVGLSLSLGGVNTVPLGTLKTGQDWQETALKIVQMASTRRVKDIVLGLPLETDGTEGRIARLVRHFGQILADASLLVLGGEVTIFLWDERFSTAYASVRLITKPRFDGGAFKSWLDGQKGLSVGAKSLLDAEAARTILEHWLEKDPMSGHINKERSERVPPSKEACLEYLKWKKRKLLRPRRPAEPAGPGKEGWEWADLHPEDELVTEEDYEQRREAFSRYKEGMDNFGDRDSDLEKRRKQTAQERARDARAQNAQDQDAAKGALRSIAQESSGEYDGLSSPKNRAWGPRGPR